MDTKVLIGVITGEYARRADFYDYYNLLEKPDGTMSIFCHDRSPAHGRNMIIDEAARIGATHILFIDDDMAFKPDALKQLLSHDLDVVTGLYLSRAYPHRPLIFDLVNEHGHALYSYLDGKDDRLKKVANCGFGFCLINTRIFKKFEKPYVRLGEIDPENWCDDIGFFNRVTAAGINIYCDMDCLIGHIGTVAIWPVYDEGAWYSGYDTGGDTLLRVPQQVPANYEIK